VCVFEFRRNVRLCSCEYVIDDNNNNNNNNGTHSDPQFYVIERGSLVRVVGQFEVELGARLFFKNY
jgi:hypothetical protein